MQFYLNGYAPGDPDIRAAAPGAEQRPAGLPDDGRRADRRQRPRGHAARRRSSRRSPASAPAWSSAATARSSSARPTASPAARWRCSRLSAWAQKLVREAYWVNETVVLAPVAARPHRGSCAPAASRTPRTACRRFPHVIVNQARMQQYLLELHAQVADAARARLRPGVRRP